MHVAWPILLWRGCGVSPGKIDILARYNPITTRVLKKYKIGMMVKSGPDGTPYDLVKSSCLFEFQRVAWVWRVVYLWRHLR